MFEIFSCFRKKSYCLTNSTSLNNLRRILVDFEYIGLFLFRATSSDLSNKISGGDFGIGKFLIGIGVKESMFSVAVTVVLSFLFISKDNKDVVKSISDPFDQGTCLKRELIVHFHLQR